MSVGDLRIIEDSGGQLRADRALPCSRSRGRSVVPPLCPPVSPRNPSSLCAFDRNNLRYWLVACFILTNCGKPHVKRCKRVRQRRGRSGVTSRSPKLKFAAADLSFRNAFTKICRHANLQIFADIVCITMDLHRELAYFLCPPSRQSIA